MSHILPALILLRMDTEANQLLPFNTVVFICLDTDNGIAGVADFEGAVECGGRPYNYIM